MELPEIMVWPLSAAEYLAFTSAESQKKIEQERRKPTLKKLGAWYRARMRIVLDEAPDLDTYLRMRDQVEIEYLRVLANENLRRRAADRHNIDKASKVRSDGGKELASKVKKQVETAWEMLPRRQRTVHNITKLLCNPEGKKLKITKKMGHWKYRWMIDKKLKETIPFWTIHKYVDYAVKPLKSASA